MNVKVLSNIPSGWSLQKEDVGVQLLKRDSHYVVSVDLSKGAGFGMVFDSPRDQGTASATFRTRLFSEWNRYGDFFAIANSYYFGNNGHDYVPLPFPLIQDGNVYSQGNGGASYDLCRKKAAVVVDDLRREASVVPLETDPIGIERIGLAKKAYVGFISSEGNRKSYSVGRTFIGLLDKDGDGANETMLMFVTPKSTHDGAVDILVNDFGCSQRNIVTFDGGGSSKLIADAGNPNPKYLVQGELCRGIPMAFVVKTGK